MGPSVARPVIHAVHVLDSLAVGGMENGVVNLINATRDHLQHTVVTVSGGGPLSDRLPASVPVHCIGKGAGVDLGAVFRLSRLLRRVRPDVVHSRNWGAFDTVLAARLAGLRTVVHGEHGREAADPEGLDPRRNGLRRVLAPLVSRFVTVSFDLRRWLITTVRIPAHKVVTIHNGVDTTRFVPGDSAEARETLGLPTAATVVGTIGRLDPVKDQAGLIAAFSGLVGSGSSPILAVVGEGPSRPALEREIRRHGLADRVRLFGERRDVPTVLRALDVFVLPSRAEGMSNTILEAMATGLPVVATDVGGNPELVESEVTGRLVPSGDPGALEAALRAYVTDSYLRSLQGKAGRERVLEHFSLDRMAQAHGDLYTSLCQARQTGGG
jgi:sugar transferase (PEP-CTERM/EpsH1 system associated)